MEEPLDEEFPGRVLRSALVPLTNITESTPENTKASQDELIIQQRGRRCKPITWSPVDYNKTDLLGEPREKTPDKSFRRTEISMKLRRRLVMSPERNLSTLGDTIAKKLKAISDKNGKSSQIPHSTK